VIVTMVNPRMVAHSAEVEIGEEGCLSVPGKYGNEERFTNVTVEFFDLNGERQVFELNGLNARVAQHEMDHINWVLFVDRLKEAEGRNGLAM
ncbi:MAG: peptide deformylase, partial [Patescibacteria group bacterium]